jgi:hypothetical protein
LRPTSPRRGRSYIIGTSFKSNWASFAAVTSNGKIALAIWYTPHSDRTQRDMLTAAINETLDEKWARYSPTAKADILALVSEADSVADRRNDAIHAPVSLAIDKRKLVIIPLYFHGNPYSK